jgi:hypothetical protein
MTAAIPPRQSQRYQTIHRDQRSRGLPMWRVNPGTHAHVGGDPAVAAVTDGATQTCDGPVGLST